MITSRHPRTLVFLIALVAAAAMGGCDRSEAPEPAEPAVEPPESATVAVVNGEPVTEALLDAYLRNRGVEQPSEAQTEAALRELVNLVLLRQQARRSGLAERPDVQADLALQGLSTLAGRQIRAHLDDNPVTEEQAREEFERKRQVAGQREYHLRHILLRDRRTAEMVITTLDEGGVFEQLAEDHSIDERNDAGGDLGWVNLAQLPEPLPGAAKALEVGQHSPEPVQSRFGWHVLKVEDTRELEPPAFDQVKSGLISSLQRARMEEYVRGLREGANIQVSEEFAPAGAEGATAMPPAAEPESEPSGD